MLRQKVCSERKASALAKYLDFVKPGHLPSHGQCDPFHSIIIYIHIYILLSLLLLIIINYNYYYIIIIIIILLLIINILIYTIYVDRIIYDIILCTITFRYF